jgi:CubicO group peptidase (beta-lactamase class C family)
MSEMANELLRFRLVRRLRIDLLKHLIHCSLFRRKRHCSPFLLVTSLILLMSTLAGCGPSLEDLQAVEYTPLPGDDWPVSTPAAQGVDPMQVAELYYNAAELETIYGLLVVKDGHLVAEKYFNEGSIDELSKRASVTKSYTSALVGIALEQGYLSSLEQKMLDFFPDLASEITDNRKEQITVRQMLQMRAGYPWEETDATLWDTLWDGEYLSDIVSIPLTADPGSAFQYSNLTAHWLGIIVARAAGTDLKSFGDEHLFSPLGVEVGDDWNQDLDGYYIGCGDIQFTARDMAKFGLLYLNGGEYEGSQIISADWVQDSLQTYSQKAWDNIGRFHDIGYGYQWWSARAGEHDTNFAWGHGGNLIVLVHELDMVVVVTADSFYGKEAHWDSWKYEKANIELVANFISSLPLE